MKHVSKISIACCVVASVALAACGSDDDGVQTDRGKPFDLSGGATHPPAGSTEVAPGGAAAVDYPAGPYGTDIGSVAPNMSFLGWKNATAENYDANAFDRVSFADFYDPDGSKGNKLLVINASAVWCGP